MRLHHPLPFCLGIALALLAARPVLAQGPTPAPETPSQAYFEFLMGRHLESEGQVDEAIAAHERAARLDPRASEVPAELASLYARQGRLLEARTSAETALKIDAANVEAHRVLGTLYAAAADSDGQPQLGVSQADAARLAIQHLEQGRRRDGTDQDPGIDLALGRLYLTANDNEKALQVLRRLIEYQPEVTEAYVLMARAETALGRPEAAVKALEEASETNPRVLSPLAELYEGQQRWADAARAYERLVQAAPGNTDAKVRWASALLQGERKEGFEQARTILREVTGAAPNNARALFLLSTAERRMSDFAAAESAARKLMALTPDSPSGAFALAQVYEDQRLFAKAADVLAPVVSKLSQQPQESQRDLVTLAAHLGYAELQAGRAEAAIETFERVRKLTGDNGSFDTSLIQAYMLARRYDRASELARSARNRRPQELRFAQLEARALAKAGRGDRAVVIMRDAVAAHGDNVQAHLALAETLQEAKRPGEADQVLAEAAQRFPAEVLVPFQRGALLEQRKDFDAAEVAFRDALARDPLHAPTLNYLGYMLAERGERLDEAVTLVERALTVDPGNGSYLDSLGWALFKQKQYAKAQPLLERAAEQAPANSVVLDHLGDLYWATGRRSEAVSAWRRALAGDREQVDVKSIEGKIAKAR